MTSVLELLRRPLVMAALAAILGLIVGIPLGWATVRVVNTTPAVLRPDLQQDYLRMAIESFQVNPNPDLAVRRWDDLGAAAAPLFVEVQQNPQGIDPAAITAYGQIIQTVKGANPSIPPAEAPGGVSGGTIVLIAVLLLLLVGGAAGVVFMRRILRNPVSAEVSPGMQATEINREAAKNKTNFESLGVAPPITQNMTTYVLGDDLYDESFSIDTPAGDFLGEYGVGVSETIGVGDPKKVTALEIWLFDKNDIKTATKVLMSMHAFGDAAIRSRLEAKGELIQVEPRKEVMLETETLQLLATVVDLQYGDGSMPDRSYFDRVTLELAIWHKAEQPAA
ncbi:MAG: hypothetical protein ACXWNQ_09950 [Anaerolineales bacterium]